MIFTIFPLFHSKSQTLTLLTFNHDMLIFTLSYLPFFLSYLSRTYDKDDNKDFHSAKELSTVPDFSTDYN